MELGVRAVGGGESWALMSEIGIAQIYAGTIKGIWSLKDDFQICVLCIWSTRSLARFALMIVRLND
jgi:hypothetical protein